MFNTSMTGYQEVLTDPSYTGQLVTMTYPLIGNYGVNDEDCESPVPQVAGFVVREASRMRSNWRSTGGLDEYLRAHAITGISEIDTRALTRHLRSEGAMRGAIAPAGTDADGLRSRILAQPKMEGLDLAGKKIGFFAMGDAGGYPYNFLDAMGQLWEVVKGLGGPELVGVWPTEGYEFDESQAMYDDDHFLGLGLDEENQSDLHDERIHAWLMKVMTDCKLLPA